MSLQTETLKITGLRVETLAALNAKACELGKTAEEYARDLIEEVAMSEITLDATPAAPAQQSAEQAAADWAARMKTLAQAVDAAWQGEKSALDELAEMRR